MLTDEQKKRLAKLSKEDRIALRDMLKDDGDGGGDGDVMATLSEFQEWRKKVDGKLFPAGDPPANDPPAKREKKSIFDHILDSLGV